MRLLLVCAMMLFVTGCARNYYNIPNEIVGSKIQVLGVAPIIVDVASDIRHPSRDQLVPMLAEVNKKYESQLINTLKTEGNFFSVMPLGDDPQQLFANLYARREQRDDAGVQYNKYFWKIDELRQLMKRNKINAVFLPVISGLTRTERAYAPSMLWYQTSDFNYLLLSAQIVDADGSVLWEYPNFRTQLLEFRPLVNLQYPDFSEAEANVNDLAAVKFKSVEGIRRALEKKRKDLLLRSTQESEQYNSIFDDMVSLMKFSPSQNQKQSATAPTVSTPNMVAPSTAVTTAPPEVGTTPPVASPKP